MVWLRSRSPADAPSVGSSGASPARFRLTFASVGAAVARSALALCFPRVCAVCERALNERDRHVLCGVCVARLSLLGSPRCERCGHPGVRSSCSWCHNLDDRVGVARSLCWMTGGSGGEIVHALKYRGWPALAMPMAERVSRLDGVLRPGARNALLSVPLARARERERGYNQSAVLASELAARWQIPVWNTALERTRDTPSQTALTPQQRLVNVADAFSLVAAYRARCRGAHLILVDDVITTGATMNACATAMFAAGARSVAYVTFGRARAPGDAPT